MIFDQQRNVYKLAQTIPLSFQGGDLFYYITVEDSDGNSISTGRQTVSLPSKPNLTVFRPSETSEPSISYGYSTELQKWGLNVQLKSSGTAEVPCSVQILAFGSDPDRDDDMVVDEGVQTLGQAKLDPEDWDAGKDARAPDEGIVSVFIPLSLTMGRHPVFVWIDPEFDLHHPGNVFGACAEANETDNISFLISRRFLLCLSQKANGADMEYFRFWILDSRSQIKNQKSEIRNLVSQYRFR